jgi:recombination protein RecR
MADYAAPLARLIDEVRRLPGVGQKSAQRIAFHLLRADREQCERLAHAIVDIKDKLGLCVVCNNISDAEQCVFCTNPGRNQSQICVIEEPLNIIPIENTRSYSGLYHVLHGAISPLRGIGPEQLRLRGLLQRLQTTTIEEVILATNPTVEGEATASYLSRLLKPLGVRVTRIAMGIPVGSDLEYADEVTMSKSLENRREL